MKEFFCNSVFFGVMISILAYELGMFLYVLPSRCTNSWQNLRKTLLPLSQALSPVH